jgi:hypothetical protein
MIYIRMGRVKIPAVYRDVDTVPYTLVFSLPVK